MVGRLYRLPTGEARRRAGEVLERFELTDAADRRVSTYSGGMRRRLDLGASLVGRPPVLLLDEPTTGLDPLARQELWAIVDELRQEGTTILLTTQYLEEADRLAQRIAVVDHGRIVAEGAGEELKTALGTDVLIVRLADASALGAADRLLGALDVGGKPQLDPAGGEIRLAVSSPDASVQALRRLDEAGIAITALELRRPSLDDVFVTLTGDPAPGAPAALPTTTEAS